jgi:hypothetical protein
VAQSLAVDGAKARELSKIGQELLQVSISCISVPDEKFSDKILPFIYK